MVQSELLQNKQDLSTIQVVFAKRRREDAKGRAQTIDALILGLNVALKLQEI